MLEHLFHRFINNCRVKVQTVSHRPVSPDDLQPHVIHSTRDFQRSTEHCDRIVSFHQCSMLLFKVHVAHTERMWTATAQPVQRPATGWTVRGSNRGWGRGFRNSPGAHPASYTTGSGTFPGGVKRPGRGVDHPPTTSTEAKERVELNLYSPLGLCGLL